METRSQCLQIQLKVDLRTITLGVPPQEVNDGYYPQHLNYTVKKRQLFPLSILNVAGSNARLCDNLCRRSGLLQVWSSSTKCCPLVLQMLFTFRLVWYTRGLRLLDKMLSPMTCSKNEEFWWVQHVHCTLYIVQGVQLNSVQDKRRERTSFDNASVPGRQYY